jgi:drug/metabolite transporter (DMT)-like permease
VLSLGIGVLLLGEVPTAFGMAGVLLILAGSYIVVDTAPGQRPGGAFLRFFSDRGVQLRLAALACSATEAVFLKHAILRGSPEVAFLCWSVLGLPVAAAGVLILRRDAIGEELLRFRRHWRTYFWLAFATGLMQLATLLTFGALQVGYSLALFQLSTLISVFLGSRYFGERDIRRRLLGAGVMVAGAILIVSLGGR